MPELAELISMQIHVLGGGIWIGAMVFSVLILPAGAARFFSRDDDLEDFIFTIVHGLRWPVVAGIFLLTLAGAGLWVLHGGSGPAGWNALIATKAALLVLSLGLFVYVSFGLWPRRVFATALELPKLRRRFMAVGLLMITTNVANLVLGISAHWLRH